METQEINFRVTLKVAKYDDCFVFVCQLFTFYKKVPYPLDSEH